MVEHTPGPWEFDRDWHRIPSITANGLLIASVPKKGLPNRGSHTAEQAANARLITAAPDLLEALVEARAALHQHYIDWDGEPEDAVPLQLARSKCDAAIARTKPLTSTEEG